LASLILAAAALLLFHFIAGCDYTLFSYWHLIILLYVMENINGSVFGVTHIGVFLFHYLMPLVQALIVDGSLILVPLI
jgi:hypothetical protein